MWRDSKPGLPFPPQLLRQTEGPRLPDRANPARPIISLRHERGSRSGSRRTRGRYGPGVAARTLLRQGRREDARRTGRKAVFAEHEQRPARRDTDVIAQCRPPHALAIHPGAVLRIQVLDQEAVTLAPNHEM